jgi:hypothetical protein
LPNRSCLRFALTVLAVPALACVAVDQDRVLAKDLAELNPWFTRLDPGFEIGLAPLAGSKHVIKGSELAALARRVNATPDSLPDICIERATQPLTVEQLQPVLAAALGGSPVQILDFSRYRIPRGAIEFTRAGLTPSGLWRGRVTYGQNHSLPIWARIGVGPAAADSAATKLRAVERGERITVEVTSGAARLAFQATAQSGGRQGDSVLVQNPESGRLFQAKVIGNGKVLIHK